MNMYGVFQLRMYIATYNDIQYATYIFVLILADAYNQDSRIREAMQE